VRITKKENKKEAPQSYLWFDLVKKDNVIQKRFKFNGKLNGDVLEQKLGCCTTFTSKRAALVVEWCHKSMRYKIGKKPWVFMNIYGKSIKEAEFEGGESCLPGTIKLPEKPKAAVDVKKGSITISEKGKPTTTLKDKGTVVNKDQNSKSTDTPSKNKTEKKGETTISKVDGPKVEQSKAGGGVTKSVDEGKDAGTDAADKEKKDENAPEVKKPEEHDANCDPENLVKSLGQ